APTVSTIRQDAATSGRMVVRTGLPHYSRRAGRLLLQTLAGEGEEALAGLVVRPERLVVGVLRVGCDLLGDRADLAGQRRVVLGALEQGVDPALRTVVVRYIVVEEKLAEQEAGPDVGERPEGEDPVRRLDEPRDLRVLVLDLLHDRADRLVEGRNP